MKVLFILKSRSAYGSYGLINSCKFVANALNKHRFEVETVKVVDANDIDREVTKFKPRFVIIEALWVTPEKIQELIKLHPHVKWVVRIHSHTPFLANESIGFDWLARYQKIEGLTISTNDTRMHSELRSSLGWKIEFLPNLYDIKKNIEDRGKLKIGSTFDIGCFGALRFLKNQVEQAIAALIFADKHNCKIKFHINTPTVETGLESHAILKNLEAIFRDSRKGELVKHPWLEHDEFLKLVEKMDAGLQVSFSETFNIVSADFVASNVPIVTSKEVSWMNPEFTANPNNPYEIAERLDFAFHNHSNLNFVFLKEFSQISLQRWLVFLRANL